MSCPYTTLPASSFWRQAVAERSTSELDPHLTARLRFGPDQRIASAGSCFAQHISRALKARGYNYYVTETAPGYLSPEQEERFGYGIFSARYGNIYSTLQLLQLLQRAFGGFQPADQFWTDPDGRVFDLLRPRITPKGFVSMIEAEADLKQHLRAVRKLIETADVFIFTLGLTESWVSKLDGTVYPTCPGCGSAGDYDDARYAFHNLSVTETTGYLAEAINLMSAANPRLQIILTVSPVPLAATMESRHVMQATTYSKSVLRVAAEEMVRRYDNVHYFASYEIITNARNAGAYFADDARSVTPEGVARAMNLFFAHFTAESAGATARSTGDGAGQRSAAPPAEPQIVCDEDEFYRALAASRKS
ncbi:GSCFA domain-containing protein [Bradyrhizobium sp. 83002]|uniref:GSCFA domain-containing protein n=1 Tax=Bradyrhizobium aeschynomenes TaxID=2734909 RepID=UPI0015549EEF|nr:GSCFA domain-containing protein [Bradyrhizobium aeschynomenes]NPU12430.1 GSCFA domain-containing protein [Bradyrhizobium aeschynomenes]NPV22988.1 GSCFA domain-containing protein [Bradyrhizobium aeschynomenes]